MNGVSLTFAWKKTSEDFDKQIVFRLHTKTEQGWLHNARSKVALGITASYDLIAREAVSGGRREWKKGKCASVCLRFLTVCQGKHRFCGYAHFNMVDEERNNCVRGQKEEQQLMTELIVLELRFLNWGTRINTQRVRDLLLTTNFLIYTLKSLDRNHNENDKVTRWVMQSFRGTWSS